MQLENQIKENISIVALNGDLDFASSQQVSAQLMDIVESSPRVVLDMSQCKYVSSSGLRVLLLVGKRVKQLGDCAVLCSLTDDVKEIMEMTGFGSIFKCFDDVETAVRFINAQTTAT